MTIETTLQTYSHLYPNKQSAVADKLQSINEGIPQEPLETAVEGL